MNVSPREYMHCSLCTPQMLRIFLGTCAPITLRISLLSSLAFIHVAQSWVLKGQEQGAEGREQKEQGYLVMCS